MVGGATFDRCTIGTCGPAAYTSVCSPPYSSTTASTTWAAASSEVRSSWYAEARAPQSRADGDRRGAGRRVGPVGHRHVRAALGQHARDRQPEAATAADDQGRPGPSREVVHGRLVPPCLVSGHSVGREVDGVPAGGAVGQDVALDAGLHLAVAVDRAHPRRVVARLDVDGERPLDPRVLVGDPAPAGPAPLLAVDRDLHPVDPGLLCPGHAADADVSGRYLVTGARSRRSGTRSSPGPARPSPARSSTPRSPRTW